MTDSPIPEPRQRMLDLLWAAARLSWREREPMALLAGLYAVLTLIAVWPFRGVLTEISILGVDGILKGLPPEIEARLNALLLASVASYVVWCAILGIWTRLIFLGRSEALSGGAMGVIKRTLGIFLRLLEFVGIFMVVAILCTVILGVSPGSIAISIAISLAAFMLLAGVFGIAAYETACDKGRWLAATWLDLKGRRGVLALSLLILFLPSIALDAFTPPAIDTAIGAVYLLVSYWVWGLISCIWMTYSGLVARELASPQKGS